MRREGIANAVIEADSEIGDVPYDVLVRAGTIYEEAVVRLAIEVILSTVEDSLHLHYELVELTLRYLDTSRKTVDDCK